MSEMEWKTIEGFPTYKIYQDGRVYSERSKRVIIGSKSHNYRYVDLRNRTTNTKTKKSIHRLVAEHFIPNPENKPIVDHIDRDRTNNMYWNLRWATKSENGLNSGVSKNNKLGEKYIYYHTDWKKYVFEIRCKTKERIWQPFNTLDEAIKYRNEKCKELDLVY